MRDLDFIPEVTPPGLLTGELSWVAATRCPYMHLCAGKRLMKTSAEGEEEVKMSRSSRKLDRKLSL